MPNDTNKPQQSREEKHSDTETNTETPKAAPKTAPDQSLAQDKEAGGRGGLDPTRYGDWEKAGRCIDF